jgi:hypothetical protein
MFRLCSEYLAQKLVCSEFLDFVVMYRLVHGGHVFGGSRQRFTKIGFGRLCSNWHCTCKLEIQNKEYLRKSNLNEIIVRITNLFMFSLGCKRCEDFFCISSIRKDS